MPADELTDVKSPQKVIHFSSGETLTEDSEEEEEIQPTCANQREPGKWTWKDYPLFWGARILRRSLGFCDFLGEKMAALLGLNAAKYQYAIDQYHRDHKNKSAEGKSSLSSSANEERINLSEINKLQYGATNTADMTEKTQRETAQIEGFSSE